MFDSKLYYQQKKGIIREYQNTYYYNNADMWKIYSAKYSKQKKLEKQAMKMLKQYFFIWKKRACHNVHIVNQPFVI